MLRNLSFLVLACSFLAQPNCLHAQSFSMPCKAFAKRACKHVNLVDYVSNGQLTVAPLVPGEQAELAMIFYRGNDYRIVLCGAEELGALEFSIANTKGEELFNNKQFDMSQDWDFSMSSTQRLIITVGASGKSAKGQAVEEGCVKMIVGHRKTPKSGFY